MIYRHLNAVATSVGFGVGNRFVFGELVVFRRSSAEHTLQGDGDDYVCGCVDKSGNRNENVVLVTVGYINSVSWVSQKK